MDVARHDDLVAAVHGREHHRLHGRGRAADHEESVRGVERVGGERLGVADDGDGMTEVVEHLHRVDVHIEAGGAEEIAQLGVAAAALVSGYVERYEARPLHALERL